MNYAFRMKLKPGTTAEYKRRHDEIWPELAQLLREAGIYDYSIFLDEEDTAPVRGAQASRQQQARPAAADIRSCGAGGTYMQDLMYTQPDGRPNEWPLEPVFHLD